jgi:hypothetical protein
MALIMIVVAAGCLGAWLRRWSLLALPVAAGLGAGFLMLMPGSGGDSDNPLVFLLIALEMSLAAGIVIGNAMRATAKPA